MSQRQELPGRGVCNSHSSFGACLYFSPNRFICRGSGGVGNTGLGPKWENRGIPRTTFVRRRGTSCMSPSPLCGEMVGRTTFDRETFMNLSDFPSKTDLAHQLPPESWGMPSESLRRAPGELPESLLECLGGHSDQI